MSQGGSPPEAGAASPRASAEAESELAPRKLPPPRLRSYVALNFGVWAFLALQAWLLTVALGSARMIVLFTVLIALGFSVICVFDYFWLHAIRKKP